MEKEHVAARRKDLEAAKNVIIYRLHAANQVIECGSHAVIASEKNKLKTRLENSETMAPLYTLPVKLDAHFLTRTVLWRDNPERNRRHVRALVSIDVLPTFEAKEMASFRVEESDDIINSIFQTKDRRRVVGGLRM